MNTSQQGILLAVLAYVTWGLGAIYFKLLSDVPAKEMLSHRIFWSFILITVIMLLSNRWRILGSLCKQPKKLLMLVTSGLLIVTNWFVFIYAIGTDQLLEASLGYYINPLLTILLGLVFYKEKLSRFQWVSISLAFLGVLIQIIIVGTLPWISLILAVTFSVYGLLRKIANVDSFAGLAVELFSVFFVAVYYLFFNETSQTGNLLENGIYLNLMLAAAGIITTTPLLFFAGAAKKLNLSALGFLQYITPSMIWLMAVFIYHEPVTQSVLITFCFIWAALLVFSFDGIYQRHQNLKAAVTAR
jgi:chloramphenicol-sensitive protein RarD